MSIWIFVNTLSEYSFETWFGSLEEEESLADAANIDETRKLPQ